MTIQQAFHQLKNKLTNIYEPSEAANIADWVMESLSGKGKLDRLFMVEDIPAETVARLKEITEQLLQHRPVQYVLGETWFWDLKLFVDGSVLIPRPETEELVDWIVKTQANKAALNVLDIGTGSGCIALALKKAIPEWQVTAIDLSPEALNTARKNAATHRLDIHFRELDFLNPSGREQLPSFDLIISNPPYISPGEKESILPNVLSYEPHTALFVTDNDPLQFYKAIESFARKHLHEGGYVFCELHRDYAAETAAYFTDLGWKTVLKNDMQDNPRMLQATRS